MLIELFEGSVKTLKVLSEKVRLVYWFPTIQAKAIIDIRLREIAVKAFEVFGT